MGSTGTGMNIEYIPGAEIRFIQDDDRWNLIVDEWATVYEGSTTALGVAYTSVASSQYQRWEIFSWNGRNWLRVEWRNLSFNEKYKIVKEYFRRWGHEEQWRKVDKVPWDNDDITIIMLVLEQA